MFCKFCGAQMPDECNTCPECGKSTKSGEGWKIAVISLCAVILGAALVIAVLFGAGILGGEKEDKESAPAVTDPVEEPAAQSKYTFDDETAKAKSNEVVAVLGDQKLTNSELQFQYRSAVYNFLNNYYYYLSAIGLDLEKPFGEQICGMDETKNWEEYFLDMALEGWKEYAVLVELAKEENYTLTEEDEKYLADLTATMTEEAVSYGYESLDAMIAKEGGASATLEGLISYRTTMYKAMQYFNEKYESMQPAEDEVTAYFDEHASEFEASGITKDSGKVGKVRHILIKAEASSTDENGNAVYSDEDWAKCLEEAQNVYNLWKNGEATEDSFVALVSEYTDDPGSAETGGLYEDVSIGSGYVEPFENWAADAARQPGDTELVKVESTNYAGYHFMYYVSGQDVWYVEASTQLLNERFNEFFDAGMEKYPMEVTYENIALTEFSLG